MSIKEDNLYNLLPAVYRMRDQRLDQPLKSLLNILEGQLNLIEEDIKQLYENWFIETCQEWLVPYLGELLGVHPFHEVPGDAHSLRAYIANTINYRRRKGTVSVLEQLAHDVTGWPAKAVEFFQLLATTQHVNHPRPGWGGSFQVSGRGAREGCELFGGPFESAAHTADVRSVQLHRGTYNIPNVGIFLWRQQAYPVILATPRKIADRCYTFDPFGRDLPLLNLPQTEDASHHLVEEMDVPGELRRWPLYLEAEAARKQKPTSGYLARNVLAITPAGAKAPLDAGQLLICDLSDWQHPAVDTVPKALFAVDPLLGRLRDLGNGAPACFRVSYAYGFSADLGGGPYDRHASIAQWYVPGKKRLWQVTLNQYEDHQSALTLGEAVARWQELPELPSGYFGVIAIVDNSHYQEEGDLVITVPEGSTLAIVAAKWLSAKETGPGLPVPDLLCPHIRGNLHVEGGGTIILDGLWLEGSLVFGKLASVRLAHCSVVSEGFPAAVTVSGYPDLNLSIDHCITGPVAVMGDISQLLIADSVIDGKGYAQEEVLKPSTSTLLAGPVDNPAIIGDWESSDGEYIQPCMVSVSTCIERSTVFGAVRVSELTASESIFTHTVKVGRSQKGCIRFSYLPLMEDTDSILPQRFRCQPYQEIEDRAHLLRQCGKMPDLIALRKEVSSWLRPTFVSQNFGDPAYGQLLTTVPEQIRKGAEDGSEMGAFCHLKQAQREDNLIMALQEYLRVGLEAGIFYIDHRRTEKEKMR